MAERRAQDAPGAGASAAKEKLPPLSDHDYRQYNSMADKMDWIHDHFRQTWNLLWEACTADRRPQGMSAKQLLRAAIEFADSLNRHHAIEETHFFPKLSHRMPEFRAGSGTLVRQHALIHEGLDAYEEYVKACGSGEVEFEMGALKEKMEGWGGILWTHLDDEVKALGAENMRKYWSMQEMRQMIL